MHHQPTENQPEAGEHNGLKGILKIPEGANLSPRPDAVTGPEMKTRTPEENRLAAGIPLARKEVPAVLVRKDDILQIHIPTDSKKKELHRPGLPVILRVLPDPVEESLITNRIDPVAESRGTQIIPKDRRVATAQMSKRRLPVLK